MKRLYVRGNVFFIQDQDGNLKEEIRSHVLIKKKTTTSTNYTILFENQFIENIEFADIRDENGTAFATQTAFETWANSNTGFSSASGGSGAGGAGFVIPNSATTPFPNIAARNTWATANPSDLIENQTVVRDTGTPDVWYLRTGDTNPSTADPTDWLDVNPLDNDILSLIPIIRFR